ncbi:MAG: DUF4340 domain-containing protein [Clostridiales bacterium]|nr:DUF4340 domain-containing protein [Clostridiales bacterium]
MAEKKKLSKNVFFIIIGLSVVLILSAVLLALTLTDPEKKNESSQTQSSEVSDDTIYITSISTDDISNIEISNSSGIYSIKKVNDNFAIPDLKSAIPNEVNVNATVNAFAEIEQGAEVGKNLANLDEYGLAKPSASFTINYKDGSIAFDVGNYAPNGSGCYIMQKDSKQVYLVSTLIYDYANYSKLYYVDLSIIDSLSDNSTTVDQLIVRRKNQEDLIIEALPEPEEDDYATFNTHMITSPIKVEADSQRAESIIYDIFGLTADSAYEVELNEDILEKYGLSEPEASIFVKAITTTTNDETGEETKTTKNYKLSIGNPIYSKDENGDYTDEVIGYYGIIDGIDVVYGFSASALPWVDYDLSYIMSRKPLMPYIYSVNSVEFGWNDEEHKIDIIGDSEEASGKLDGEVITIDKVKELYQYLLALPGEEVYSGEAEGEPIAWFRYNHRDGDLGSDLVEIFESPSDRKVIIQINGKPLFKTRQMYGIKLIDNFNAFVYGGEITQDW